MRYGARSSLTGVRPSRVSGPGRARPRSGSRTRRRPAGRRGPSSERGPLIRSVTATRRASPAAWPSVSLTTLKSSRSMNRTAVTLSRRWPFGVAVSSDALEAQLEHPPVRRAGQRVALGQVLDVPQQDGVAQVERRHRGEPGDHRGDPPLDARQAPVPWRTSTTMAPTGRPSAIIGATIRLRASGRAAARNGSTAGSSRLTGRTSWRSQARRTIQSGSVAVVGTSSVPCVASATILPSEAPSDDAPLEARSARRGRPARAAPARADRSRRRAGRRPRPSTGGRARRWRSSRSLSAEKAEVAIANSQNDVTLRTGIRSNSMALPGVDLDRRDQPGGLGVEDHEQKQRVPERDLEAGPIRGQERDGDQVEVDQEADRALGAAGAVHRVRRGRGRRTGAGRSAARTRTARIAGG